MTDKLYYSKREFLFDEDSANRDAQIDAFVSLDKDGLEASLKFSCGGTLNGDEFEKFLGELADTALALRHAFVEARRKLLENYQDKEK